ncbi:uncharacterized protein LOC110099582 isoform X2 [Dendrobium catenatum]|uniref:uncharacterized protein LOC110099582 isoform X2 n=1 Tax=Dendrobium catenatum TaxID=906689 RepID=UPI0010A000E4|nr:uncharacterized protein LOC110099582 isoform X2 [Dendrobium catenatum]
MPLAHCISLLGFYWWWFVPLLEPVQGYVLDVADSLSSSHSTYRHPDVVIPSNAISMEKLPDASILLSSPSFSPQQYAGTDHSSRIASTIPEIASRKREPNGSGFIHPPNKHPRGNLPHSRNILDTVSGTLIPPQLKGRSNVVTEDIRKLFVNRHREPSG